MTAREHTHRGDVNPSDATDDDVQQIVNLLRQRSGSATVEYLRELSGFAELQLRACLDELRSAGRIEVRTGISSVKIELRERDNTDRPIVTDGSGLVEDLDLSVTASDVFEILSSPRRREMVKQLAELTPADDVDDTYVELGDLATLTATSQLGVRPSDLEERERHRAYVSICQVHAETLDEYDVAEYYRRVKKIGTSRDVLALAQVVDAVEAAAGGE